MKWLGMMLTTHLHLVLRLRMSGTESLHGVVRDNLTLTFTITRTGSFSRKLIPWKVCLTRQILGRITSVSGLVGSPKGHSLTLHLLTWRIWWAPNNASKGQMGFNSARKGLSGRDRRSLILGVELHGNERATFFSWSYKNCPHVVQMASSFLSHLSIQQLKLNLNFRCN